MKSYERFLTEQSRVTVNELLELCPNINWHNAWNSKAKSRLIESLIINIPVPGVVFLEDSLVEGFSRIKTLKDFLNEEFALEGLELLPSINGYTYNQLDYRTLTDFHRTHIHCYRIFPNNDTNYRLIRKQYE